MTLFMQKHYSDSVKHFTKAVGKQPNAIHHNNLGLAYYHLKESKEAMIHFNKAIEYDQKDPNIFFNRGNVFLNDDKYEDSRRNYDMAIEL